MEEDMIFVDSVLDKTELNWLLDETRKIEYLWFDNTTFDEHNDAPSLVHMPYDSATNKTSAFFDAAMLPLETFCFKNSIKIQQMLRIRIGLMPKWHHKITHTPHVDFMVPHKTFIYYLTTNNNAETFFYKEKHPGNNIMNEEEYFGKKTFDFSVEAKANTGILFDGLIYHSSNMPTEENKRLVISYNFI
jgi:hypothetical protein